MQIQYRYKTKYLWIAMKTTKIIGILTQKDCTVDLATQLIENLNTLSKIAHELDKLVSKNWGNIEISKDEKKVLRK